LGGKFEHLDGDVFFFGCGSTTEKIHIHIVNQPSRQRNKKLLKGRKIVVHLFLKQLAELLFFSPGFFPTKNSAIPSSLACFLWLLAAQQSPITVTHEGLYGFPTKNGIVLVVTLTGLLGGG